MLLVGDANAKAKELGASNWHKKVKEILIFQAYTEAQKSRIKLISSRIGLVEHAETYFRK